MENNQFSIRHIYPRNDSKLSKTQDSLSQLKNPLILVGNLSISPVEKDASFSVKEQQVWNISLTLAFYIRGVSSDHLIKMNQSLDMHLGNTQNGELINRANKLLSSCKQKISCTEENKIADIVTLLNAAKDTYKNILSSDKTSTPIARVKRRSDLMTTVSSIQKKLTQIEEVQNNTP